MGIITKDWLDKHDAELQKKLEPLSDAPVIKTLNSAPTGSTLSYLIDEIEHAYQIGDEVRVVDANAENGYTYYKLYNITGTDNNRTAVWSVLPKEPVSLGATIKVTLQSIVNGSQTASTALNGTVVSVQNITDNTTAISQTWAGKQLVFDGLAPTKQYTVSVGTVTGYTQPSSWTTSSTLDIGEEVSHTFQYEADEYTISISGHQNGRITYNSTSYSNEDSFKVPEGTSITTSSFTAATIEGYKAKLTLSGKVLTCIYKEYTGYVDLGLPSGKLWAVGNIVSDGGNGYKIGEETDYGAYFSWGNTVPHFSSNGSTFDDGYNWGSDASETYHSTPGYKVIADIATNDAVHDAALALLGTPWHLPTKDDFQELKDNTDSEWTTIDNVNGYKFMKKADHSVYIFFPATGYGNNTSLIHRNTYGYYWSATNASDSAATAYAQYFSIANVSIAGDISMHIGQGVRAIQIPHVSITITLDPTDESSVNNVSVQITDSEGFVYLGTTDSNGTVTVQNVGVGTCTIKATRLGLSTYILSVTNSNRSFTINCHAAATVTSYIIDQSDTDALAADYIVKGTPSMSSNDDDDVIHRIWSNTKLYAAKSTLSNNKLQVRELSRSSKALWADGTKVVYATGDNFMKLPEFWWKCEEVETNTDRWQISFTMDNPNDASWNHWEGNTFIGCYEAVVLNTKLYSKTNNSPTVSTSFENFRDYAIARGTGYSLISYEAHCIMALLGYGWLGTTDAQSVIGYGSSSYPKNTGTRNANGIYDTSADIDGGATAGQMNNGACVNFWGLENWWGDVSEWVDNLIAINNGHKVRILIPGTNTTNREVSTSYAAAGACLVKAVLGTYGDLLTKSIVRDTSYSKGYASYSLTYASNSLVALRSGYRADLTGGLGYLDISHNRTDTNAAYGSRLQYQGDWEIDNTLT